MLLYIGCLKCHGYYFVSEHKEIAFIILLDRSFAFFFLNVPPPPELSPLPLPAPLPSGAGRGGGAPGPAVQPPPPGVHGRLHSRWAELPHPPPIERSEPLLQLPRALPIAGAGKLQE